MQCRQHFCHSLGAISPFPQTVAGNVMQLFPKHPPPPPQKKKEKLGRGERLVKENNSWLIGLQGLLEALRL